MHISMLYICIYIHMHIYTKLLKEQKFYIKFHSRYIHISFTYIYIYIYIAKVVYLILTY